MCIYVACDIYFPCKISHFGKFIRETLLFLLLKQTLRNIWKFIAWSSFFIGYFFWLLLF